jgi:hypothetical protein
MQPNGRITVFVQSSCSGSSFLNFIGILMLAGLSLVQILSVNRELVSRYGRVNQLGRNGGLESRAVSKYLTFPAPAV